MKGYRALEGRTGGCLTQSGSQGRLSGGQDAVPRVTGFEALRGREAWDNDSQRKERERLILRKTESVVRNAAFWASRRALRGKWWYTRLIGDGDNLSDVEGRNYTSYDVV